MKPFPLAATLGLGAASAASAFHAAAPCPAPCAGLAVRGTVGALAGPATGYPGVQPPPGATAAFVPAAETLERLNLRAEWASYLPMDGREDGIGTVQVVAGDQVFVQTRLGRLLAIDAATGARQWSFRYPKRHASLFPIGVTDRLLFAVHVTTLYCFHRYTGVLEFEYETPGLSLPGAGSPTAGPVADERNVYLTLGSSRMAAYQYPVALQAGLPPRAAAADGSPIPGGIPARTAADDVAGRYSSRVRAIEADIYAERTGSRPVAPVGGDLGLGPLQKTPSIATLPRITPPYSLAREVTTPSISVLPSLREPYTLRPPFLQYGQQTPSIASMPPSAAAAYALANIRNPAVEPTPLWLSRAPGRPSFEPILTVSSGRPGETAASQVWVTTEQSRAFSVAKATGLRLAELPTSAPIAAPVAGPVALGPNSLLGFFALEDGSVLAVDLPAGTRLSPSVVWRANVGGYLNKKPVPTAFGVYASGDGAGVARIDVETGEVVWRTDATADTLLAVNDAHAYVRDRRGNLLIYPRDVPPGATDPRVVPLASLDLSGFTVPVTNGQTDRVILGSHTGLLMALRDLSPSYNRPLPVALPSRYVPPPPPPMPVDPAN